MCQKCCDVHHIWLKYISTVLRRDCFELESIVKYCQWSGETLLVKWGLISKSTLLWVLVSYWSFTMLFPNETKFDFANITISCVQSQSYLTGVTTAELWWHLSDMNVIWYRSTAIIFKKIMKERNQFSTPNPRPTQVMACLVKCLYSDLWK